MGETLSLADAIILSGVAYGVFISVRLFISAKRHPHDLFLGFLMLSFAMINWRVVLISSSFDDNVRWLLLISPVPVLAIMPSLYCYLETILSRERKLNLWLHYLPFFLHLLYQCVRFLPQSFIEAGHEKGLFGIASMMINIIFIFQVLGYTYLTFPLMKRIENLLKRKYSDEQKLSLSWLRSLYLGCLLIFLIWLSVLLFFQQYSQPIAEYYLLFISISILIYWVGTRGLAKSFVYDNVPNASAGPELSDEQTREAKELLEKIKQDKLYLIPQLQVRDVAEKYNLPAKQVSTLLNKGIQKNFYQLINEMRIDCFCREIDKIGRLSVLGLALDCGFHSKSVFNKFFKEYKQMTPKEYLMTQKKGPDS